jgi:ribonuclease Z
MDLKRAVRAGRPDDFPVHVAWSRGGRREERCVALGTLRREVMRESPGQKLAYVTDVLDSAANHDEILTLARAADLFYCEAGYPARDADRARARYHLTTVQAGRLAAEAGARHFSVFHLSPKYRDCPGELVAEAMGAFAGGGRTPGMAWGSSTLANSMKTRDPFHVDTDSAFC